MNQALTLVEFGQAEEKELSSFFQVIWQNNFLLTVLESWKCRVIAPTWLGGDYLSDFSLYPHMVEGAREPCEVSLLKLGSRSWGLHPHELLTITLSVRTLTWISGRHTHSDHNKNSVYFLIWFLQSLFRVMSFKHFWPNSY